MLLPTNLNAKKHTLIIAKCKAKTRIQTCHKNLTNAKQMKWWAKGSQAKSTDVKSTEVHQCRTVRYHLKWQIHREYQQKENEN